mgnify:FL=1
MRKAGELAGVGEGGEGGHSLPTKFNRSTFLRQHNVGFSNKIKTYSVFKTAFCR